METDHQRHTHTHTDRQTKNLNDVAKTSFSAEPNGCCLAANIQMERITILKIEPLF